jgi:hypothetical protein
MIKSDACRVKTKKPSSWIRRSISDLWMNPGDLPFKRKKAAYRAYSRRDFNMVLLIDENAMRMKRERR